MSGPQQRAGQVNGAVPWSGLRRPSRKIQSRSPTGRFGGGGALSGTERSPLLVRILTRTTAEPNDLPGILTARHRPTKGVTCCIKAPRSRAGSSSVSRWCCCGSSPSWRLVRCWAVTESSESVTYRRPEPNHLPGRRDRRFVLLDRTLIHAEQEPNVWWAQLQTGQPPPRWSVEKELP